MTKYLFFGLLSIFHFSWGVIIPVHDLVQFEQMALSLSENDLVLWDVDYTLILPKDRVLRYCNRQVYLRLIREILNNPDILPWDKYPENYLSSKRLLTSKHMLIDTRSPELVSALQSKKIKTIALTAAGTGPFGIIPSLEDWRIKDLLGLGFDFTPAFSQIKCLLFPEFDPHDSPPLFKEGILFSSAYPKGGILALFLQKINWKPKKVIFIDDCLNFIKSVELAMKNAGIDFIGYYYMAADKLPSEVDEKVGEYQFLHFAQYGEWLSDEEAAQKLPLENKAATTGS